MPFTGSHPAAVLPLGRTGLVPSALVIGSMIPDLPYFVALPVDARTTHTVVGALTVDVALGLAVFCLWQGLLAPAAIAAAPAGVRARLDQPMPVGIREHLHTIRGAASVALSLAIGALTHVVWDSFTHRNEWGVARVDWLAEQHRGLPGYVWAQYLSGIVGAVVIVGWAIRWYRRTAPANTDVDPGPWWPWLVLALAAVLGAAVGARRPLLATGGPDWREASFHAAAAAGSAVGLVALLLAVGWALRLRRR